MTKKRKNIFLFVFAIILFGVNMLRITHTSVCGDEAFSMLTVRGNVSDIISTTAADVHPPLYYFILKFATLFLGENIPLLRMISLVPIGILLGFGIVVVKKEWGEKAAAIFMVCTALPPAIRYNVELRMYSYAMLAVLLCLYYGYKLCTDYKKKYWIGFTLFGVAAAYLHYYALITVAFIYAGIFLWLVIKDKKRIKSCLICSLMTILLYVPWLPVLLEQFQRTTHDYWIGPITWWVIKGYFRFTFGQALGGKIFGVIVLLLFLLTFVTKQGMEVSFEGNKTGVKMLVSCEWLKKLDDDRRIVLVALGAFAGNIVTGVALSLLFRPIFSERYIFVATGLLWLAIAIMTEKMCKDKKWLFGIFVLFLIITGGENFWKQYEIEKGYTSATEQSIAYLEDNMGEQDILLTDISSLSWTILEFHFPNTQIKATDAIDWSKNEQTVWFLASRERTDVLESVSDLSYCAEYIKEGSINSENYILYKIWRPE